MHEQGLEKLYFTTSQPSSFGGVQPLIKSSKLDKNIVEDWLLSQNAYTLHKPARRNFQRNKTRVAGIDDQWQADFVDMSAFLHPPGDLDILVALSVNRWQ